MKKALLLGLSSIMVVSPVVVAVSCGVGDTTGELDDLGDDLTQYTEDNKTLVKGKVAEGVYVVMDITYGRENAQIDQIIINGHEIEEHFALTPFQDGDYGSNPARTLDTRPRMEIYSDFWQEPYINIFFFSMIKQLFHVDTWKGVFEHRSSTSSHLDETDEELEIANWEKAFAMAPVYGEDDLTKEGYPLDQRTLRWELYVLSKITIDNSEMGARDLAGETITDHKDYIVPLEYLLQYSIDHREALVDHSLDGTFIQLMNDPEEEVYKPNSHVFDSSLPTIAQPQLDTAQSAWEAYVDGLPSSYTTAQKNQMKKAIEFENGHAWIIEQGFRGIALPADFEIPAEVQEIGANAFSGATLPIGFTVPDSVVIIDRFAFEGVVVPTGFEFVDLSTIIALSLGNFNRNHAGMSRIPLAANFAFTSTRINEVNEETFRSVSLPDGYEVNDYNTLVLLQKGQVPHTKDNLVLGSSFTIPNTVTELDASVFWDMNIPSGFVIPSQITTINRHAFGRATLPMGFVVPTTATSVSSSAFVESDLPTGFVIDPSNSYTYEALEAGGCTDSDLHAPAGYVAVYATTAEQYKGQTLQAGFTLPSTIKYIAPGTFAGATLPEGFTLPSKVEVIAAGAFEGAKLPASFTLPSSLIAIEGATNEGRVGGTYGGAFEAAELQEGFTLNEGLKYLGTGAFEGAHLPNTYREVGVFKRGELPHSFRLPSTLQWIAGMAFAGEKLPTGFQIPHSVLTIGPGAFQSASAAADFIEPTFGATIASNQSWRMPWDTTTLPNPMPLYQSIYIPFYEDYGFNMFMYGQNLATSSRSEPIEHIGRY